MPLVVCIGAVLIDELYHCNESIIQSTSNPSLYKKNIGGVMGNIARHLSLLEINTEFITVLGNDTDANYIIDHFTQLGLSLKYSVRADAATGKYVAIHEPNGQLYTAVCTDTLTHLVTADFLESKKDVFKSADLLVADTNLEIEALIWLTNFSFKENKKLIIEPVSVIKARKINEMLLNGVFMITPNEVELQSISQDGNTNSDQHSASLLEKGIYQIWVRKGSEGSVIYNRDSKMELGVPDINIKDSTGAGDAALAGWIFAHLNDYEEPDCLKIAHSFAMDILQIEGAVDTAVTKEKLLSSFRKYYHEHE
jgi:pseudouridine kinase